MKYDRLTPEEAEALIEEIAESDWFFGEIYAELSMRIQGILKERGRLVMDPETDTIPDACVEASDEIFSGLCEFYHAGKVNIAENRALAADHQ